MNTNIFGRIPVVLWDYTQKDKAQPGEIMMDYSKEDFGHLYVKSKITDQVFDLDRNINDISETTAEDVKVTIDGVTTTLYELLFVMKKDISEGVKAAIINDDVIYVQKQYGYDDASIETSINSIQVKGFNGAADMTVPIKKDGIIQWVALSDFSGNSTSIPGSSNADDGIVTTVVDLEPLNDKIILLASKKQMTKYLNRDCKVFLPRTLDGFIEINWCLLTNNFAPSLIFPSNVIWEYRQLNQPSINNTNIYTFKTWDHGENWVASIQKYNKSYAENTELDINEISKYFPTKEDLASGYYTKEQSDYKFIDTEELADSCYSKDDIVNLVSWKGVVN